MMLKGRNLSLNPDSQHYSTLYHGEQGRCSIVIFSVKYNIVDHSIYNFKIDFYAHYVRYTCEIKAVLLSLLSQIHIY